VADRELAFLIIGLAIGVIVSMLLAGVQSALSRRANDVKRQDAAAERRARQLRQRLQDVKGEAGSQLEVGTALSGLFSNNGVEGESVEERGEEGQKEP
jgi:hypothetical protein